MDYRIALDNQLSIILKTLRKQKGMTQAELGEKLGMSQRSVAQLEARPDRASFERVFRAFNALGVDLFLRERDVPTKNRRMENGDLW